MAKYIETPFFMFNSKYDAWQLASEFQSQWTTRAEQDGVIQYGKDFMSQFNAIVPKNPKNGAMITSCICHGCPWNTLTTGRDAKTAYQHYAEWMSGATHGAGAIHIDQRTPNGGGAITDPHCKKFP